MSTNRKPRVLFLGPIPPPFMGPTLATEVILNSSLKDRYELIHLDTSDHRPLSTLGAIDLSNIYLAMRSYVLLLWLIITKRPKIVYIPISQTTLGYLRDSFYIIASRVLGRKVVCHLRGGDFKKWLDRASHTTRFYVRAVHRMVHCQIVLGRCLKGLFDGVLPEDKIYVVPNGKDISFPDVEVRNDELVRILYLGNMMRTKGVIEVLQSSQTAFHEFPKLEYMFAGAWIEPDTRRQVDDFLAKHPDLPVHWVGATHGQNKLQLLKESDIFVFPSYSEGHPWVIVEAMAAGLPIISTDEGAIRESVIDGENGFIVPKRSPSHIAERIVQLARDARLRRRMGDASLARYREHFTEAKLVENMSRAFDSVLSYSTDISQEKLAVTIDK